VATPAPLGGIPLAIGAAARIERISPQRETIISGLQRTAYFIAASRPAWGTKQGKVAQQSGLCHQKNVARDRFVLGNFSRTE